MKTRQQPSLAAGNTAKYGRIGGWLLAASMIGFVISLSLPPTGRLTGSGLSFLVFVTACGVLTRMLPWWQGDLGEKRTLQELASLSDDYSAITNVMLPGRRGDIDLVVCGPFGALAVEVKTYAATYRCEGDDWFNVKENGFNKRIKSPTRQARSNANALKRHLKFLGHNVEVHAVVVLAKGSRVTANGPTVPVIKRAELCDFVRRLPPDRALDASVLETQ